MPSAFAGAQAGSRDGIPMAVTQYELDELVVGAALTAAAAERRAARICRWLGFDKARGMFREMYSFGHHLA